MKIVFLRGGIRNKRRKNCEKQGMLFTDLKDAITEYLFSEKKLTIDKSSWEILCPACVQNGWLCAYPYVFYELWAAFSDVLGAESESLWRLLPLSRLCFFTPPLTPSLQWLQLHHIAVKCTMVKGGQAWEVHALYALRNGYNLVQ